MILDDQLKEAACNCLDSERHQRKDGRGEAFQATNHVTLQNVLPDKLFFLFAVTNPRCHIGQFVITLSISSHFHNVCCLKTCNLSTSVCVTHVSSCIFFKLPVFVVFFIPIIRIRRKYNSHSPVVKIKISQIDDREQHVMWQPFTQLLCSVHISWINGGCIYCGIIC